MPLYLVRHAKAGNRGAWEGPDAERPVSRPGRRQAEAIAEALAPGAAPPILSSPAVRCVQTVEPLAERLGTTVEVIDTLGEGAPCHAVLALLEGLPDGSVLCSHGDVIPEVVEALVRRGLDVEGRPDWRKGATWVLTRDDEGRFVHGRALPPPDVD